MCFNKETKTTKAEAKTVEVPQYIKDASSLLVTKGTDLANKPFDANARVADFTPDQLTAFQKLRDSVANSPIVLPDALQGAKDYAGAPAQNVGTERVVDQGGWLGSIGDYINPNTDAALTPALRKISEAAQAQRLQSNAAATASGAFGDARHGVVESGIDKNQDLAVGDTSSQFFQQAFDKAMQNRTSDLTRKLQTDTSNAGYNETALGREFAGTGAEIDRATADENRVSQLISRLMSSGATQQANDQAKKDAGYSNDFNIIQALSAALKGAAFPYNTNTNTVSTQPDNSIMQIIGAVAGNATKAATAGMGGGGSGGGGVYPE